MFFFLSTNVSLILLLFHQQCNAMHILVISYLCFCFYLLLVLDVLYKDYGQQPPVHFQLHPVDLNCDVSFHISEFIPGLGTYFRVIAPYTGKMELRYVHNYLGITSGFGLVAHQKRRSGYTCNPTFSLSGVTGTRFFSVGTAMAFDVLEKRFGIDTGLSFTTPFFTASLTLSDMFDTLRASCYQRVIPKLHTAIAAELKHRFSTNETSVTMGTQVGLFPWTCVKARVNTKGRAAALFQQSLFGVIYMTVVAELNFTARRWGPKLGVSFAIRPPDEKGLE